MAFKMEGDSQLNLEFYKNQIKSEPNGDFIENILDTWKGDYVKLSRDVTYIQWLFPNKEPGKNPAAHVLTGIEAEMIAQDPELNSRVKRAFEMMLDYFGMELDADSQFQLTANSDERLRQINVWGDSSFLYITRILLALKELGHDNLMLPWMIFLADLIYKQKKLDQAESSFEEFWMPTLEKDDYVEIASILEEYKQS